MIRLKNPNHLHATVGDPFAGVNHKISTIRRGVGPTRSRPYSAPKTCDLLFASKPPEQKPGTRD
jgi:hypothetical protein